MNSGVAIASQLRCRRLPARLRLFALVEPPPAAKIDESKIALCGVRGDVLSKSP